MAGDEITSDGILYIYHASNASCFDEISFNITIGSTPDVEIIDNVMEDPTYPYNTDFSVQGSGYTNVEWYLNGALISNTDPLNVTLGSGTNEIILLGIDSLTDCLDSAFFSLGLNDQNLSDIVFPTVITPNSDGVNDFLRFDIDFNEVTFSVFYRWGTLIYRTNETKTGWNGRTIVGTDLDEAVYYFIIKGTLLNGEELFITRSVTVIR